MKKYGFWFLAMSCLFLGQAYGQSVTVDRDGKFEPKKLKLPYAFYNESFGAAVGFIYGVSGYPQKQATTLTTAMVGSNGSALLFFIGKDFQTPFLDRLFVDPVFQVGYFANNKSFTDGKKRFFDERAGTNDSKSQNFIKGDGFDNYFRFNFKYLLPIGDGKNTIIDKRMLDGGLLVSGEEGGTSWNPLESGKTFLEVKPFFRKQEIGGSTFKDVSKKTNGLKFSLFVDNVDFQPNPSKGYQLRAELNRDWQWFNSSAPYTSVNTEFSKYFSLGPSDRCRQRVFAFDFWTSDALTWNDSHTENGKKVFHRPPTFTGSSLGGLWRMRGFPSARFSDKSAIYYSAEYRVIPKWNPIANTWIQKYIELAWWQWVPFVEVGRVAGEYDLSTLHSDMKWCAGFGVRGMVKGLVVRIDTAASKEQVGVQMFISQPFQF
jgi:hypothetical protein